MITETIYLRRFFGNLLLGEHNELKNRTLHIYWDKNTASNDNDLVNDLVNDPVKPIEKLVLRQIQQNSHITYNEIAFAIGKSSATVRRAIQALKATGLIERIGSDKTGYWKILT